jgi:hypothetical protein
MTIQQSMSLYIPHVFPNISKYYIANIFMKLDLGKVIHIEFVSRYNEYTNSYYNSAYIHFEYWFENLAVQRFQEHLENPDKKTKLVYDDPWYWNVQINHSERRNTVDGKFSINLYATPEHGKSQMLLGAPRKTRNFREDREDRDSVRRRLYYEYENKTYYPFPSMDL